jgi:hypothetical protein
MNRPNDENWRIPFGDRLRYAAENYGAGAVIVALLLVMVGLLVWNKSARNADREGAKPRTTPATITRIDPPSSSNHGDVRPPVIWVQLEGNLYRVTAETSGEFIELRAGQTVEATFVRGKSGKIYVTRVRPMRPAEPLGRHTNAE